MKIYKLVFISLLMILIEGQAYAQSKITQSVFGNGGLTILSETHRMSGTIGQTIIGQTSSQINIVKSGIWYSASDLFTSVDQKLKNALPTEFYLEQNYPNPFNPTTKIRYSIPVGAHPPAGRQGRAVSVQLKVYDILGKEIATLVNEQQPPGNYEVTFNAVKAYRHASLPSGIYFYQLQDGDFIQTKKMIILK